MKITTAFAAIAAILGGAAAFAQDGGFSAADWEYGPRFDVEGEVPVWSTAKQKIMNGEDLVGGTIRATDPRTYCAMANAGYDFTWVEMQHEQTDWEQVARMYAACPNADAVHGVRLAETSEREAQHALDAGAMVIVYPTIDSVEEAEEAISWVRFPPLGRHSAGGGQGPSEIYRNVEGGYRETFNDNVVLILMIETLEGVEDVEEIAALDGYDALMVASGDLGNFSGYSEGDEQYEQLVTMIADAAEAGGKALCGPLRWRSEREGFTCFQAGTEASVIRRGVQAEAEATARPAQ
ncbi:HpcH/HpaI aldolase family protein [Roseitranquillus sediminis]|uniref:HpcH/HpaI aldolase family protein n=1 Tax=Roseitranquillus sediminis TaxID=2809051 RepID=UPI001D0C49E3|nr:aldolase/citrate lyase family protein [Roseitranquillus sediminis]MBM9596019.1 hypothetical protein [Roseitranquillus sediminis]